MKGLDENKREHKHDIHAHDKKVDAHKNKNINDKSNHVSAKAHRKSIPR
jgi:hypothetical protein